MLHDKELARATRHRLQELSAFDPAAQTNMIRYVRALRLLVAGRSGRDALPGEPEFLATFQTTEEERMVLLAQVHRSGLDHVLLAFDIDDAAGPPVGLAVIRSDGERVFCWGNCQIWAPEGDGRAILVPVGENVHGRFAFQDGSPLLHSDDPLPGDFQTGARRGLDRLVETARSPAMLEIEGDPFVSIVEGHRGGLTEDRGPIAIR